MILKNQQLPESLPDLIRQNIDPIIPKDAYAQQGTQNTVFLRQQLYE
ncbi:hypothetical protein [Megasphaera cerevisiae]|nr:hypothetical protein [Megasphaera cerevisiae]